MAENSARGFKSLLMVLHVLIFTLLATLHLLMRVHNGRQALFLAEVAVGGGPAVVAHLLNHEFAHPVFGQFFLLEV